MPHSRSAKKRMKQNEVRRLKNKAVKSNMRTQLKKVKTAVAAEDAATARKELVAAMRKLDKAARQNVIHRNEAARRKSRLQKEINALESGDAAK